MTLMSKAAEMVLFGTVLYSGYQLLPGVPHVPAPIDAAVFVIQQGALDIGGMGLLKLAKRAGLPRDAFPVRLGAALVVLMILNVALASIKHTFPMIAGGVFVGIETVLLIARAVVAVLFGHAIYALREEYGESTITLKEASELQQCMDELSSKLVRVQQDFHCQLSSTLARIDESFHQELSSTLAPVHESFQQYQEALSQVPMLKAHLQHLESSTVEEIDRVKAFLEKQLQGYVAEREKQTERPVLHALPPVQQNTYETGTLHTKQVHPRAPQAAAGKFDARAFVFACLQEHPDLKLAEIEQRARAAGQLLSQPTASRYRKQFLRRNESSSVVTSESSIMKAENIDESSTRKMQGINESTLSESSTIGERRVVGE